MADDPQSSTRTTTRITPESRRRTARFSELLNTPSAQPGRLDAQRAWAMKMRDATCCAVQELHVQVLSARPLTVATDDSNNDDMRFELETDRGRVFAIRTRDGRHRFEWK